MKGILFLFVQLLIPFFMFSQDYPFQNANLPLEQRMDDLIARMTLEEKVAQLSFGAPAIERLGIPSYNWWNECLHGVARAGRATIFPQAIGLAATFDEDLLFRVGDVISTEARAKYNVFSAKGNRGRYQGLTFWSPNVNLFRDPRWGRGQETYGEDPHLISKLGVQFVKGLQGDHPQYLKAAGMAKHYAVHSGPEELRHEFNAIASPKDLWETYLPAFEALVTEAKVEGVMGAYNRTNDQLCCAHDYLMQEVLRDRWGFDGYFVSDCWAIVDFYAGHKVVETPEEAAALALNMGCNLNCGSTYPALIKAIENGQTTEAVVDANLRQLLKTRFRLGMFDPLGSTPWDDYGPEKIRHPDHVNLSLEAATKSMVLLKNENETLPLTDAINGIYVVGPTATHAQALLANYYGVSEDLKTILEGIVSNAPPHTTVHYSQGALLDEPNRNPMDWFSGEATLYDVTIACLGISQLIEGEEGEAIASKYKGDRKSIQLPQSQIDFLKNIRKNSKKLVVVVTGGSAIAMPEVYELADALIFAWYPGEQGGKAVADILFGKANPSGRLPVTFPYSVADLPDFEDYNMAGRTYRYMEKEPFLPFGFGLSYTSFTYNNLQLSSPEMGREETLELRFTLSNTGLVEGEEVVQLYIKNVDSKEVVPLFSLKAFQRVKILPGEEKELRLEIRPDMLETITADGSAIFESGKYRLYIGGSLPTSRSKVLGSSNYLTAEFELK
ncbi:MAG: glycoside hydrolase family 3 C-terminal domain-containing protein [Bacteroidota bacterium]